MGALESNTTNIYGIHIRESANDGSDFSNAASDYRVLFVGEDGLFHLKDSAGTVTTPAAGDATAHIADSSDAHDASAISVLDSGANFTGTDVEAVLAELQDNIDGVAGGGSTLAALVTDASHTPAGAGEEAISYDTEVRDDGGFFSAGSPTRLTIPSTGWYLVTGYCFTAAASSTDSFIVALRVNGTTRIAGTRHYETTNAVQWIQTLSTIHYFTATDYVEMTVTFAAEALTSRLSIAAIGLA